MHFFERLKQEGRLSSTLLLAVMSLYCLFLSLFRIYFTGSKMFFFLNWNLFLAFVPWMCSSVLVFFPRLQEKKISAAVLVIVWILFFPNAPYIFTDLLHLSRKTVMPKWFDLILILSFAWTGLVFGFISLFDIEKLLLRFLSETKVTLLSSVFLFTVGFGIYLGRYLRWNSWDVLREPYLLFYDISERITDPFSHPATWGMTVLMGILLNMMYISFRMMVKRG